MVIQAPCSRPGIRARASSDQMASSDRIKMLDSKALEQFYPSVWMDIALVARLEPGKPADFSMPGRANGEAAILLTPPLSGNREIQAAMVRACQSPSTTAIMHQPARHPLDAGPDPSDRMVLWQEGTCICEIPPDC